MNRDYRNSGKSVRAVLREKQTGKIVDTTNKQLSISGKVGEYTYVDLGLPSGTKWATYNVGANKPTEYGDYFAWGETKTKESYEQFNYTFSKDSCSTFTKYCMNSKDGTVDSLTTLLAEDDAATTNWGEGWRMPTNAEVQELGTNCNWEWTENFNGSGVVGYIGTSKKNGNTIFLPAAGGYSSTTLYYAGDKGFYWSSTLYDLFSCSAFDFYVDSNNFDWYVDSNNLDWYDSQLNRFCGNSVRAVVKEKYKPIALTISGKVGGYTYVDLGLPSGTKWATYNVGATKPAEYGGYFAWGETTPKEDYSWATYKYESESYKSPNNGKGSWRGCSKYTIADGKNQHADSVAWYDSNGNFIGDSLTTLLAEDDAATANWGKGWRMPTLAELKELRNGCEWKWTYNFNNSGVAGRIGTSKMNGNTIFLPAAGYRYGTGLHYAGSDGHYWSSLLDDDDSSDAYELNFSSGFLYFGDYDRDRGLSVRAVVK